MSAFIDTSVLVAAVVATESFHTECDALFNGKELGIYAHGIAETFSTLTGGRKPFRMPAALAASVIEEDYVPDLSISTLTPTEMLRAMREAEARGVRGGAIFDFLHLVAARKAKATRFYTLNIAHFLAFYRAGDPEIMHP